MSPRAVCRLETLGFERLYDYVTGKSDWRARGLSLEGEAVEGRASSPFEFAFVVSAGGVLLGLLRAAALDGDPAKAAETVMEPGPSTLRRLRPPKSPGSRGTPSRRARMRRSGHTEERS
jgi:hypothetical protein